jgi:dihydroorotate dehydrogenase
MADLSMEYAGLKFKNPIIAASGPTTDSIEMVEAAKKAGFGGMVLKSMGYKGYAETSMMKGVPRYKIVNRLDYTQRWTPKLGLDNMGLIVQGESISVWTDKYLEFVDDCKKAAGSDMLIGAYQVTMI